MRRMFTFDPSRYAAEYEQLEAQHQTQFTEKRADVQRLLTLHPHYPGARELLARIADK